MPSSSVCSRGAHEIERCRRWLDRERAIVAPELVVALGAAAARSLFGRPVVISKMRGSGLGLAGFLRGGLPRAGRELVRARTVLAAIRQPRLPGGPKANDPPLAMFPVTYVRSRGLRYWNR